MVAGQGSIVEMKLPSLSYWTKNSLYRALMKSMVFSVFVSKHADNSIAITFSPCNSITSGLID